MLCSYYLAFPVMSTALYLNFMTNMRLLSFIADNGERECGRFADHHVVRTDQPAHISYLTVPNRSTPLTITMQY